MNDKLKLELGKRYVVELKLEVGKRYVRRDGKITGVIVENDNETFSFRDSYFVTTYTEDGSYWRCKSESKFDLVKEYIEETPTQKEQKEEKYAVQGTGYKAQPFTKLHDSYEEALTEAQRLAKHEQDSEFYVVKVMAKVSTVTKINTKEY